MRLRCLVMCLAMSALSGCIGNLPFMGDPLDDVDKLSDVELASEAEAVSLIATPTTDPRDSTGFFASILGRVTGTTDPAPVEADPEAALDSEAATPVEGAEAEVATADTPAPEPETGGLFGFLRRVSVTTNTADAVEEIDPNQVAPLTAQAFGVVGKTCGLSRRDLGSEIAHVSGYRVYDTFPNSTASRPHYITGFDDGCARQFSAALVLTGDVGTHEIVRYQGADRNLPYTETDQAYEDIKAGFCGAGQGQPCGARIDALSRNTTFVTAYESFASSPTWAELLLHDGGFVGVSVERR